MDGSDPRVCRQFCWRPVVASLLTACSSSAQVQPPTALVQEYGQLASIPDLDGDGQVTDADFRRWLAAYVSDMPIGDVDGDGYVTCEDAVLTLAMVLDGLAGNLASDGIIDAADVATLLAKILSPPPAGSPLKASDGDVNADGVVDVNDLLSVMAAIGEVKRLASVEVARSILAATPSSSCYVPIHSDYFSGSWPDGKPDWAPPNHEAAFSQTWPPQRRQRPIEWPPNHANVESQTWPYHSINQSSSGPPWEHWFRASLQWHPNHVYLITREWTTPQAPGEMPPHVVTSSIQWDPNHRLAYSRSRGSHQQSSSWYPNQPSPHLTQISHYDPPNHQDVVSGSWPSNHFAQVTNGWPQSHSMNASYYWPPNHFSGPSATWPTGLDPAGWRPNHFAQLSREQQDPGVPTHIWPPNHTWFTTIHDTLELLPWVPTRPRQ